MEILHHHLTTRKKQTNTDVTSKDKSTSTDSNSSKSTNDGDGEEKEASKTTLFVDFASGKLFDSTVSALKESVSENGMMVLGNVNQAKGLKTTGLQIKGAHSFFIGNPAMSKQMFKQNAVVGVYIPVRVHVWVNKDGETHIGYLKPSTMLTAISPKMKKAGALLDKKLSTIAKGVSGGSANPTYLNTEIQKVRFVQTTSKSSYADTVSALKQSISKNGLMVLENLNQAKVLETKGLQLKGAQSFFAGNPAVGKNFFKINAGVGAYLPVRIYVWVDKNEKTQVGYYQPTTVLKTINSEFQKPGSKVDEKVSMIVKQATK